jgi:heat shock protein HslJ
MRRNLFILFLAAIALMLVSCGGGGASSLDGTDWVLTSLNGASPLGSFALAFTDGQVTGKAGCNSYFGDYDQSGDTLSIPMIGITEMYCMDPEGIMDQESLYVGILSRVDTFSTSGTQLRLETGDGAFLIFEAVE